MVSVSDAPAGRAASQYRVYGGEHSARDGERELRALSTHAGHHHPPDHAKGDESTLGGYHAVHSRPPAFDGIDGRAYSVDLLTEPTGDRAAPWGAYLFFVQWSAGEPEVTGHLETGFIVTGNSEAMVRHQLGAMPLATVKATLDGLIRTTRPASDSVSPI